MNSLDKYNSYNKLNDVIIDNKTLKGVESEKKADVNNGNELFNIASKINEAKDQIDAFDRLKAGEPKSEVIEPFYIKGYKVNLQDIHENTLKAIQEYPSREKKGVEQNPALNPWDKQNANHEETRAIMANEPGSLLLLASKISNKKEKFFTEGTHADREFQSIAKWIKNIENQRASDSIDRWNAPM